MKIKVIIYDHVPTDAFISRQLKLHSLFDLFVGKSFYETQQSFPPVQHQVTFEIRKNKIEFPAEAHIAATLKDFDRIVLWPLNQRPLDLQEASIIVSDALKETSCRIKVGCEFAYVLSHKQKDQGAVFDRSIDSLNLTAQDSHLSVFAFASPPRSSNHLEVDESTVVKLCDDKRKGMAESRFLTMIPNSVQKYFPLLLSTLESGRGFSYQIPRYEMLDLSRFLLHDALSEDEWRRIFRNISEYFISCPRKVVDKGTVKQSLRALFIEKLRARMQNYQTLPSSLKIEPLVDDVTGHLEDLIEKKYGDELVFSHGDLCFSNILLDRKTMEMKFIDARGALNIEEAFLPLEYDFAKLSQCVHGRYDWIMAQNLERPHQNEQHLILQKEFAQLMKRHSISAELVCLGEASLFLSMLPLHMDQLHLHDSLIQSASRAMARYMELAHGS